MTPNPLRDGFWLHVGTRLPDNLEWLARRAGGLVAHPPSGTKASRRIAALGVPFAIQHRGERDLSQLPLFDPDETWILSQAGSAVLTSRTCWIGPPPTPPGETLKGPLAELAHFVTVAQQLQPGRPLMAMIAISHKWLTDPQARQALNSALGSIDAPIGLMLGKDTDPLDSVKAIEGLVDLVQAVPDVAVLRCDHGALGAYAFGAMGGSIGIGTSTRHFVPIGESGYADFTDQTPRLLLPFLLAWWKGSRVAYYDRDPMFECAPCVVCKGASLARFQDEALAIEASAHSVENWSRIGERLLATDPGRRADAWIALCQEAYDRLAELEDRPNGLLEPPSKQLRAWLRFAGVPAA